MPEALNGEQSSLGARMAVLDSSAISQVSYAAGSRTLRVRFRESGRVYEYVEVPPGVHAALTKAESVGAYFNSHIRDRYRTRRVE